jgi:hypothetical protein
MEAERVALISGCAECGALWLQADEKRWQAFHTGDERRSSPSTAGNARNGSSTAKAVTVRARGDDVAGLGHGLPGGHGPSFDLSSGVQKAEREIRREALSHELNRGCLIDLDLRRQQ